MDIDPELRDKLIQFQSLLGFLMRCDMLCSPAPSDRPQVSIPAGFSDALRHQYVIDHRALITVSIPAGFSDALRLVVSWRQDRRHSKFQSLLGFLMRCDWNGLNTSMSMKIVSIPAGFSDALRLNSAEILGFREYVSIPAGFSDALRLKVVVE